MNDTELHAYLAAIVENTDDAIISKDLNGIIRSFNPAAERLFGWKAEEIVGRSILTIIPEDRRYEETEILAKLRRGERIEHFQTIRVSKDGRPIELSITVSPVRNAAGQVIGASKIAREIGGQRRAERGLSQLAAIVESSDDAIISKDLDGTIRSFNAAAERMFGYSAEEIVGRSILTLIPRELHAEEYEILARLARGQRVDHYETVRIGKDGRPIDVSLTVSPLRNAQGEVIGASKIARDVTERKRLQAVLFEQQEWFRVTLNSIGDAVIASDRDGRVTFLNHQAERLTGWGAEEAVGKPLDEVFQIVNEETRHPVENPSEIVLRNGHIVGLANHTCLISRDGHEWPIADSAAPIVDRKGGIIGVVLVFREITEQKNHAERERKSAAERERLLLDERAARSEAERANRVKDDFVAMVSHELRTPLNAILGWTELLRSKSDDPGVLNHGLEVIARNTRLQAQLISDLLDVSRIVSGKLRLEAEHVDVAEILRNTIEGFEPLAADKEIALIAEIDGAPVASVGDPHRLSQIFWNLVSNAVKFTPKGGRITIGLRHTGDQVEITVTDTGVGIRPELLPDVFERFRQGPGMTTRRHGGLGLGLSITKHLVELHGGSVRAWSAGPDQGATFTVDLPIVIGADVATGVAPSSREPQTPAETISLRKVKVLVVEDDRDTRDLVRRFLEAHRAEVVVAASAPEALDVILAQRPHVLVSDIGLPDVDGYDLVRRVRALDDPIANLPAVALTAFARPVDRTRALRAGFNAHVAKPVDPSELVITVDNLVHLITSQPKG